MPNHSYRKTRHRRMPKVDHNMNQSQTYQTLNEENNHEPLTTKNNSISMQNQNNY